MPGSYSLQDGFQGQIGDRSNFSLLMTRKSSSNSTPDFFWIHWSPEWYRLLSTIFLQQIPWPTTRNVSSEAHNFIIHWSSLGIRCLFLSLFLGHSQLCSGIKHSSWSFAATWRWRGEKLTQSFSFSSCRFTQPCSNINCLSRNWPLTLLMKYHTIKTLL